MPATFDPNLQTSKDRVRFRVGDVDGNPQWFLEDESIDGMLAQYSYDETCAQCAEAMGARMAQLATQIQQRNLKLNYQERSQVLFTLADRIRNLAQGGADDPVQTGAAYAQMSDPNLRNWLIDLPPCDPNRPWQPAPEVP